MGAIDDFLSVALAALFTAQQLPHLRVVSGVT